MSEHEIKYECFICGVHFHFGHGKYDGKSLNHYNIMICKHCYNGNWDGFTGENMDKIIDHLRDKDIEVPQLNNKGWLPR